MPSYRVAISVLTAVVVASLVATAASPTPARSLMGVGYYVGLDPNSWTTVRTQAHRLSWIITTNYTLADTTGRLAGAYDPRVVQLARGRGSKVHFRLANLVNDRWNREVVHAVLTRPAARARTVLGILNVLEAYGYDGVSIDFENIPPSDRGALTAFMKDLYATVHRKGKALSVAVPGKIKDRQDSDWQGAFDLAALGRASDWLIVMAYDEHWSTSPAGPVASLPWVDRVMQFTAGAVPRRKILLGVAFYGYDWPNRESAEAISMREVMSRANRLGAQVMWNAEAHAPYFVAFGHTVYFENAQSIDAKLALAARQGLAGVAFWRLGQELPEVWTVVNAYIKSPLAAVSSSR